MNVRQNLNKAEINNLNDTAGDFLNFVQLFGNKLKVCEFVNLWMVEDSIQSLDTITCGIFQICIYDNPEVNSKY